MTESPWFYSLFGITTVIAIAVIYTKVHGAYATRELGRLFARRDPAAALVTCRAALPGVDAASMEMAYRWVQTLVPYPAPPIEATDLLDTLFISQRGLEMQLRHDEVMLSPPTAPPPTQDAPPFSRQTVAGLMAEVLRRGLAGSTGR